MQIGLSPQPLVALIAGILILIIPRLLSYIVATYLIHNWHSRVAPLIGLRIFPCRKMIICKQ